MADTASSSLSRLNIATSFHSTRDETHIIKVMFKTGACFVGNIQEYKKSGSGVFTWPDGSTYEGDYVNNLRHGRGIQVWADRTQYEGPFFGDLRHGIGRIEWANGESYKGQFFKDRRHGMGTYTWPNGSSFNGKFYMDKKEGYGVFSFANGNTFEGLYKKDEREGPGVLTYKNGCQDVGFWHGEQLLRLLTPIADAFSLKDHTQFDIPVEDMSIPIMPSPDRTEPVRSILEPPDFFDYTPHVKVINRISELYSEDLDPRSLAVNHQAFDEEFFKDYAPSSEPEPTTLVVWNKSPVLVSLQLHAHKHCKAIRSAGFKVEKVLKCMRSGFKPSGLLEQASVELIKIATKGNCQRVDKLLSSGTVHPDVAGKEGHTALIAATVNWHQDVINTLLNHGADVNQLNDEGVSALSAGMVYYYPRKCFLPNIAERFVEKSPARLSWFSAFVTGPAAKSIMQKEQQAKQLSELNEADAETGLQLLPAETEATVNGESSVNGKAIVNGKAGVNGKDVIVLKPVASLQAAVAGISDAELLPSDEDKEQEAVKKAENDVCDSVVDGGELLDEQDLDANREADEFESDKSVHNYQIEVTSDLVERCATQLSMNERVINQGADVEKARILAIRISEHKKMKNTLELLLRRGADPNASSVPMPVLFFAIKAADVDMARTLLLKGASTESRLSVKKGGLAALHIAAAIPDEQGVAITELLLDALADPDARAEEDDSFLNYALKSEWSKDAISPESAALLGGRTPLHIACARDDDYVSTCKIIKLLLKHRANPNLMCNGYSPLALCIASGNELGIDELLSHNADPSLPLTHGVGNVLCVASSLEFEYRRTIDKRIQLIDKLIRAGADILAPVIIGPKRHVGTAVDYANYVFHQPQVEIDVTRGDDQTVPFDDQDLQKLLHCYDKPFPDITERRPATSPSFRSIIDRRISHIPYHALTYSERETYNARRKLLAHMGNILRSKAIEREKRRNLEEELLGIRRMSPSQGFVFTGAGATLPDGTKVKAGQVTFAKASVARDSGICDAGGDVRKPLFKYCYECGRSVFVRLMACTRCKEVYYCSKTCKLKAWNSRHKEECIRVGSHSAGRKVSLEKKTAASPTPATNADYKEKKTLRIQEPAGILPTSGPEVSVKENDTSDMWAWKEKKQKPHYPASLTPTSKDQKTWYQCLLRRQSGQKQSAAVLKENQLQNAVPVKGRSLSAHSQRIAEQGREVQRPLTAYQRGGGAGFVKIVKGQKLFQTEAGRWVYVDNYSYN